MPGSSSYTLVPIHLLVESWPADQPEPATDWRVKASDGTAYLFLRSQPRNRCAGYVREEFLVYLREKLGNGQIRMSAKELGDVLAQLGRCRGFEVSAHEDCVSLAERLLPERAISQAPSWRVD
ncbi:MAG: hypothetical protein A3J48_03450 [Candidatus Doudnabacteria bacterium RIFCSPHIGHO2_02_FULL_46_11]|uniref:Uncharacterized protein n=1 Tax=Candidatus Doudnabacteria bacterium RIFCSPHIGHO2_02_FULL_46_11 TaxID=1817832 RepID=A0A1F5P4L9_9BACT|nr:MAG: hypothetical protein A3J48_03450 [Candidatus Doudnabacteria bacterium RIFCSPHIGHO2_02_FULL_46_11]